MEVTNACKHAITKMEQEALCSAAAIFASAVTSAAGTAAYLAKSFPFIDPFIIKRTIAMFFH